MKQTELTVQVFDNYEHIDKTLKEQGFEMVENFQINDWYFTKYDDVSNIEYSDLIKNSILVREFISDETKYQICYKKKYFDDDGNVISEEKIKSNVSNLDNTINILKSANLNNYLTTRNNSYVYQKENVCFSLQLVDNLGIFIEYEEDEAMKNMSTNEKVNYMKMLLKNLGLKLGDNYFCKKIMMLLQK